MAKPFDATLKELVGAYPWDWLRQLGISAAEPVEVLDADLSTVTAQADKILRIPGSPPWLLHLELQSSRDPQLPRRALKYNVLLHERYGAPVHTVILLLRPEADFAGCTGRVDYGPAAGGSLDFHYQVLRLWQQPVEVVLEGGVGTLPLAPLSRV